MINLSLLEVKCPLCGGIKSSLIKNEAEWHIVQCRTCSFVYIAPIPSEQFLKLHYQQYLPSDCAQIEQWRAMMFSIFRRSIKIIETKYDSGYGTLLDVGCGYGFFLELAIKKGWDVYGVEPCKHARQLAAAKGINNISEDLFSGKYEDEMFDVITMFYVLEHLPDPMRYLKEINRILKPGGILLLRLPHTTPLVNLLKVFRIPNRLYDAPSHLSDFSPSTIALALQKAGFGQIHTCPGGFTRPSFIGPRIISSSFGLLADFLYNLSGKRFLLPGVSKTTIARKNVIHQ